MIRCHLARMMGERKMRIADVARETGLSRATVTLLYKETAQKVDLNALDRLCELFNCGIAELLEHIAPPPVSEKRPPTSNRQLSASSREGANKRGNSSRLTQSFHFFSLSRFFLP